MTVKKDKYGKNILTRLFEVREDAADISVPRIIITGNSEAIVSGSSGIIEYTLNRITLNTARFSVCVKGRDLSVSSHNAEETVVKGFIESVGVL